jgi:hypothetical protein
MAMSPTVEAPPAYDVQWDESVYGQVLLVSAKTVTVSITHAIAELLRTDHAVADSYYAARAAQFRTRPVLQRDDGPSDERLF